MEPPATFVQSARIDNEPSKFDQVDFQSLYKNIRESASQMEKTQQEIEALKQTLKRKERVAVVNFDINNQPKVVSAGEQKELTTEFVSEEKDDVKSIKKYGTLNISGIKHEESEYSHDKHLQEVLQPKTRRSGSVPLGRAIPPPAREERPVAAKKESVGKVNSVVKSSHFSSNEFDSNRRSSGGLAQTKDLKNF